MFSFRVQVTMLLFTMFMSYNILFVITCAEMYDRCVLVSKNKILICFERNEQSEHLPPATRFAKCL